VGAAVLALVLGISAGCKEQQAARTDQQVAGDIQAKLQNETALAGQNIQVSVTTGVATLSGRVPMMQPATWRESIAAMSKA